MNSPSVPQTMSGVLLTGHGGLEKLQYREDLKVPQPAAGEVLIRVGAAAVNNTDINTRIGWYSRRVRGDTAEAATRPGQGDAADAAWSGAAMRFPRVQGADCCGRIGAVAAGVSASRIGQQVLVRAM